MAKEQFSVDEVAAAFAEDDKEARKIADMVREEMRIRDLRSQDRDKEVTDSK